MHLFVYGFSKILFEAKFPPVAGEKKKKKEKFVNSWLTVSWGTFDGLGVQVWGRYSELLWEGFGIR